MPRKVPQAGVLAAPVRRSIALLDPSAGAFCSSDARGLRVRSAGSFRGGRLMLTSPGENGPKIRTGALFHCMCDHEREAHAFFIGTIQA